MKKQKSSLLTFTLSPERWFLIVALVFGTLFTFITPPFKVPDEYGHMARAYGISEGHLLATVDGDKSGSEVPLSIAIVGNKTTESFGLGDIPQLATIPLAPTIVTFAEHPNMALYSPVVYAPQALGFAVARALNVPAISSFYIARLCNVIAYVLLIYLAIRLLPIGKWIGVIIGLLPMHIVLAASLSADPITIGLTAVLVAAVLWLRSLNRPIARGEYLWLIGLTAAISLGKLPYPLLLAFFLCVPQQVWGGRKRWLLGLGGLALTALTVGAGWLLVAKSTLVAYGPEGVNTAEQLQFILAHPFGFLKAALVTLVTALGDGFLAQYVLAVGFLETQLPLWLTFVYGIFLALAVFPLRTESPATLSRWQKIGLAALIVLLVGAMTLLLYISWTPVAKGAVDGMQARYLTPLFFLLIPLLAIRSSKSRTSQGSLPIKAYQYVPVTFLTLSLAMSAYFFYHG